MKKANLKSMNKQTKSMLITYAMVIAVFIIVEVMVSTGMMSSLMQGLLVPLCIYSIVAIGLNLCVGYLGELSLGHAGFMCVGAFSSAVFSKCMMATGMNETLRFILAILIGTVVAAIFGWLIGIPVLRLRGDYLAIVTLAFGEIIKNVINVMYLGKDSKGFHFSIKDSASLNMEADGQKIIDGAKGIVGTPNQSTFVVGIIIILISLFVCFNLVNSRTGRAIMAIRDNRIAAESVGINITKYKFGYNMSIMILVFVVLGGMGSFRGSIIAAVLLTMLPEVLRGLADYRMLIYAIVLIIMMLFNWAPKAIEWREKYSIKRMFGKKAKAEEVQ